MTEAKRATWRKATAKYRKTQKGILNVRKSVLAYKQRYPERNRARAAVAYAVQQGQLVKPTECEERNPECSQGGIFAHHPDYSRKLDVEWLCTFHHTRRHYD